MTIHQARLPFAEADEQPPVVVAYGAGVDSTALIIERHARGERIDMVLRALMPEKSQTLEHIGIFEAWMDARGIPHETVAYAPARFKHWPPYRPARKLPDQWHAALDRVRPAQSLFRSGLSRCPVSL